MKLKRLEDQVIVITGASSGIGLVTARMAAKRGAKLVLVARAEDALRTLTEELKASGADVIYVKADVGVENEMREVRDAALNHFGGFDTWVNNAAVSIYGKLTDVSLEDQRRLFDTNYWGVVYGSIMAADHLAAKGGAIINIGSTLSDRAVPIQGTYSASKHAIKGFTDALRMELEHDGAPVSVTLIKPGAINTPYTEHAKNYMPTEPEVPAPVYPPSIVAEAILYAAENPVRDLFVGGGAKALSMAGYYAPSLTDKFMEWRMVDAQQKEGSSQSQDNGIDGPSGELKETGDYDGHVAATSVYTKARLHPRIAAGSLAFLATALGYALYRRTSSNQPAHTARQTSGQNKNSRCANHRTSIGLRFATVPKGQPVMHQKWGKLLFMHWRIDENLLRPHVPDSLEIDTYGGSAWVAIAPFTMWDVRALPPYVPPLPGLSAMHELNVRTYVHYNGVPGVWFFSLDTNSTAAVIGARTVYHLPYYYAAIDLTQRGRKITYQLSRDDDPPADFKAVWTIGDPLPQSQPGSREFFLTERYLLYAEDDGQLYRARIHHEPWPLQEATLTKWGSTMLEASRLVQPKSPPIVHYAEEIAVEIWYIEKVDD